MQTTVASKLAMKDTQETSMLRKFAKIQTSFAMVIQWSPQVDLAPNVSGDMQVLVKPCTWTCK